MIDAWDIVPPAALAAARAVVDATGGTIGEALVHAGEIDDEVLTELYCARLAIARVDANGLARLSAELIGVLTPNLAVVHRAVPVAFGDGNTLTVAMSDPSDQRAVEAIALATGATVARAAATQLQIAWCLARYYGHVTALGQRLLVQQQQQQQQPARRAPRTKGLTGRVLASRHPRVVIPPAGAVTAAPIPPRPNSAILDIPKTEDSAAKPAKPRGKRATQMGVAPPAAITRDPTDPTDATDKAGSNPTRRRQ